jgi:hypothetical protein
MAVVAGAEIDELEVPFVGTAGSGKTRLGTAEVKKGPSAVAFVTSRLRRLRPPWMVVVLVVVTVVTGGI